MIGTADAALVTMGYPGAAAGLLILSLAASFPASSSASAFRSKPVFGAIEEAANAWTKGGKTPPSWIPSLELHRSAMEDLSEKLAEAGWGVHWKRIDADAKVGQIDGIQTTYSIRVHGLTSQVRFDLSMVRDLARLQIFRVLEIEDEDASLPLAPGVQARFLEGIEEQVNAWTRNGMDSPDWHRLIEPSGDRFAAMLRRKQELLTLLEKRLHADGAPIASGEILASDSIRADLSSCPAVWKYDLFVRMGTQYSRLTFTRHGDERFRVTEIGPGGTEPKLTDLRDDHWKPEPALEGGRDSIPADTSPSVRPAGGIAL